MIRRAQPPLVYGAVIATASIALVSALEAWSRLQAPSGPDWPLLLLTSEALLSLILPLLGIVAIVGLTWLGGRLLRSGRRSHPTRASAAASAEALEGDDPEAMTSLGARDGRQEAAH